MVICVAMLNSHAHSHIWFSLKSWTGKLLEVCLLWVLVRKGLNTVVQSKKSKMSLCDEFFQVNWFLKWNNFLQCVICRTSGRNPGWKKESSLLRTHSVFICNGGGLKTTSISCLYVIFADLAKSAQVLSLKAFLKASKTANPLTASKYTILLRCAFSAAPGLSTVDQKICYSLLFFFTSLLFPSRASWIEGRVQPNWAGKFRSSCDLVNLSRSAQAIANHKIINVDTHWNAITLNN